MISSQPTTIIGSAHLSPPQASSSPIPSTVSDSPIQDSTVASQDVSLYTTLPQNCLVVNYEQQSSTKCKDEPCDVASTVKYEYATIISPPHQQNLRTLGFTQPSTQTSFLSFNCARSCFSLDTSSRSHRNQQYNHHQAHRQELLQHQYSALDQHLNFSEGTEQFFKSEVTDTNNIRSPHHTRSDTAHYHLHSDHVPIFQDQQSLNFVTDINNNNNISSSCLGFTETSPVSDYTFDIGRSKNTGGRISPVETDRNRGKLPPFSALLSNSTSKHGQLELSIMMRPREMLHEESDDSGVGSLEEESDFTELTNVPQTPHDNGNFYSYETQESTFGEWSLSENTILKHEAHNALGLPDIFEPGFLFPDSSGDFIMDSPTQDSDEYESGRADRGSYFSFTDAYRPGTDGPYIHPCSEHESFISSDSEEPVLEDTLPHFSEIQDHTESDKASHCMRNTSLSPKKKRKNVRESPSYVEKERKKPGRKPGQVSNVLHLWEFMRDLLHSSESQGIIEWISKPEGVFRVMNSTEVARLWGEKKKNKKKMTYEKLSRSLRYSRLEGYFAELPRDKNYPKKLCFKFGPKSKDWH